MVEIYAGADWYIASPEPEQMWQGVLQERHAPVGPATRSGLAYSLFTQDRQIPIYAANVLGKLVPFIGRQVQISGKLVDLTGEGFGKELWIGSIQEA